MGSVLFIKVITYTVNAVALVLHPGSLHSDQLVSWGLHHVSHGGLLAVGSACFVCMQVTFMQALAEQLPSLSNIQWPIRVHWQVDIVYLACAGDHLAVMERTAVVVYLLVARSVLVCTS